jgi:hypothetical protein
VRTFYYTRRVAAQQPQLKTTKYFTAENAESAEKKRREEQLKTNQKGLLIVLGLFSALSAFSAVKSSYS